MKRKDIINLYRNNTSRYTKINNLLYKSDWIITPLLFLGVFMGNEGIDILCSIALLVLAIVQLTVLVLDLYNRVNNGKKKVVM